MVVRPNGREVRKTFLTSVDAKLGRKEPFQNELNASFEKIFCG